MAEPQAKEIIDLIRSAPLTEADLNEIMATCVSLAFANAFFSAGLDLMNPVAAEQDSEPTSSAQEPTFTAHEGEQVEYEHLCGDLKPMNNTTERVWMCTKPAGHRPRSMHVYASVPTQRGMT